MKRYLLATGLAFSVLAILLAVFHQEKAPEVAKAPRERRAICILFGMPQIFIESEKLHISLEDSVVKVQAILEDGSPMSLDVSLTNCVVQTHGG